MKYTEYFRYVRQRPERGRIKDEWIGRAISHPVAQEIQADGRLCRWAWIEEEAKFLRVILLADQQTIHNAFFDRRFKAEDMTNES